MRIKALRLIISSEERVKVLLSQRPSDGIIYLYILAPPWAVPWPTVSAGLGRHGYGRLGNAQYLFCHASSVSLQDLKFTLNRSDSSRENGRTHFQTSHIYLQWFLKV